MIITYISKKRFCIWVNDNLINNIETIRSLFTCKIKMLILFMGTIPFIMGLKSTLMCYRVDKSIITYISNVTLFTEWVIITDFSFM